MRLPQGKTVIQLTPKEVETKTAALMAYNHIIKDRIAPYYVVIFKMFERLGNYRIDQETFDGEMPYDIPNIT